MTCYKIVKNVVGCKFTASDKWFTSFLWFCIIIFWFQKIVPRIPATKWEYEPKLSLLRLDQIFPILRIAKEMDVPPKTIFQSGSQYTLWPWRWKWYVAHVKGNYSGLLHAVKKSEENKFWFQINDFCNTCQKLVRCKMSTDA